MDSSRPGPRVCFYGDDCTGAVDALLQFTRAGWRSRLLLSLPQPDELERLAADHDVVGVAGIARSLATNELEQEVRPVLTAFSALRPAVVQYKACSTADSSPSRGSLGRVIEIGRRVFAQRCVPLLFAQPDFGRYTCFGHHFAAENGKVYRLDRQPAMSHHPVTPMRESDLSRHLSLQTTLPIGSLPFTEYAGPAAVTSALQRSSDAALVLDALSDEHLELVAAGIVDVREGTVFALGAGGLSTGLGRALATRADSSAVAALDLAAPELPVLVVSGSCSPQTTRQIRYARDRGWHTVTLQGGHPTVTDAVRDEVLGALRAGRDTVVSTCGVGDETDAVIRGARPMADQAIAHGLAALLRRAVQHDLTRRVVVCGGDTSSRIIGVLGAQALEILANPVGNVAVCRLSAGGSPLDGIELLLKGGQVGPIELFEVVGGRVREG